MGRSTVAGITRVLEGTLLMTAIEQHLLRSNGWHPLVGF
jgi:hypothetical protein